MTTPNGAYFRNKLPKFTDSSDPTAYESVQFKPDTDGHIFLLHPEEIEPLAARTGLVLERLTLSTNPLSSGHVKTEIFPAPHAPALGRRTRTAHRKAACHG